MFDRFNDKAMKAVFLAVEEARRMHHAKVEDGHLLLALLQLDSALTMQALQILGLEHAGSSDYVHDLYPILQAQEPQTVASMPFSSRFDRILELACESAAQLQQFSVTTEHLLIALFDVEDGSVLQGVSELGLLNEVRGILTLKSLQSAESQLVKPDKTHSVFQYVIGKLKILAKNQDELLSHLAGFVGTAFKASRCLLLLTNPKESTFRCFEYSNQQMTCEELNWPSSNSPLLAGLATARVPMMFSVEELSKNSSLAKELVSLDVKTMLAVPLRFEKSLLGFLLLQQCDFDRDWMELDDIELIDKIGKQIGNCLAREMGLVE